MRISMVCSVVMALMARCAMAQGDSAAWAMSHDRGFSYFTGLGWRTTTYTEEASSVRARSSVSTRSALLVAGAAYALHPDWLAVLDNTSTFAPGTAVEQWHATGATVPYAVSPTQIEDRAVNGSLLQRNRFSLSQSTTRAMALWRVAPQTFVSGGLELHSHAYKRFAFDVVQPDVVAQPRDSVVDESVSEVLLQLGSALESERVKHASRHYSLRWGVAVPVWRRVENTLMPDMPFTGTRGWDLHVEGRYSFAVHDMVHIGGWAQYLYARRERQAKGWYELPRSTMRGLSVGIELLWKL